MSLNKRLVFFITTCIWFSSASANTSQNTEVIVTYDTFGRVETVDYPWVKKTLTTGYHRVSGLQNSKDFDDIAVVDNTQYLPNAAVSSMALTGHSSLVKATYNYGYNNLGQQTTATLHIGDIKDSNKYYSMTNAVYDTRGYISSYQLHGIHTNNEQTNNSYIYTSQGQLDEFKAQRDDDSLTVNYQYDQNGNMTERSVERSSKNQQFYNLTSFSNRDYDLLTNQLIDEQYQFDDQGRMTEDSSYFYIYNDNNRLIALEDKNTGHIAAHYVYDSGGLRVRTIDSDGVTFYVRNSDGSILSEKRQTLDEMQIVEHVTHHITHNGQLVMSAEYTDDQPADYEYQYTDRMGNPVVRWDDNEDYLSTRHQSFSPYGEQMNTYYPDDIHRGSYGYTGFHEDDSSGLTYMKARYYSGKSETGLTGRFNSTDPARDFNPYKSASYNLYQYVGNNPVNAWDPTGLEGKLKDKVLEGGIKLLVVNGATISYDSITDNEDATLLNTEIKQKADGEGAIVEILTESTKYIIEKTGEGADKYAGKEKSGTEDENKDSSIGKDTASTVNSGIDHMLNVYKAGKPVRRVAQVTDNSLVINIIVGENKGTYLVNQRESGGCSVYCLSNTQAASTVRISNSPVHGSAVKLKGKIEPTNVISRIIQDLNR